MASVRAVRVLALMVVLTVMALVGAHGILTAEAAGRTYKKSKGEAQPEVSIENQYSGCQPRIECAPYEDDVLFRLGEKYRFTFDVNPRARSISCTCQCTADDNPVKDKLITFVGATRGTATKSFVWTVKPDGGYVTWLDANKKVLKKLTKAWSFH